MPLIKKSIDADRASSRIELARANPSIARWFLAPREGAPARRAGRLSYRELSLSMSRQSATSDTIRARLSITILPPADEAVRLRGGAFISRINIP